MNIRTVYYLLAAAALIGHILLLLLLIARRTVVLAPLGLLIAFYFVRSGLGLMPHLLARRPDIYWFLVFMDPALQLLLLFSLAVPAWHRRQAIAVAPFCLLFAVLLGWVMGPSSHYSGQNLAIKCSIVVSALWIQGACALFLVLRQRDPATTRLPLGIAFGFAVYSVMNLVTEAARMQSASWPQHSLYLSLSYLRLVVYLGCIAAWALLLWFAPSNA